jgi:hypothetical protein
VFSGAAKMFSSTIRVRPAVDPATLEPAGILNPLLASAQVGEGWGVLGGSNSSSSSWGTTLAESLRL